MTTGEPAPGPLDDPARLAAALSLINGARRTPEHGQARLRGLLAGFERLVAALPGGDRGPEAAAAFAELETLLAARGAGDGASSLRSYLEPIVERLIEGLLDYPERRLAAHGSLRPGEHNHHHVATLAGRWVSGTIDGVAVKVFESLALPDAWERLDAFEGPGYRRVLARAGTEAGHVVCNIYEARA